MRVDSGTRAGLWVKNRFRPLGFYTGEVLENVVPGMPYEQKLKDVTIEFTVGVLFRHDLGSAQKMETIIILDKSYPEMWKYDSWDQGAQR